MYGRTQKFVKEWPYWDAIFAIQMVTDYHDAKPGDSAFEVPPWENYTQRNTDHQWGDNSGCRRMFRHRGSVAKQGRRGAKFPSTMASRRKRLRAGVGERCRITIVLVLQSERVAASVTAVTSVLRG
jgi:hypothetical protein